MSPPPTAPKIYHIVHVDRVASILADGCLRSDAAMAQRSGCGTTIGMSAIKERRLVLSVDCHPGTHVGEYVPFYFCSRSVMLYVIHMANHPELAYRGGQAPIVHLEADLLEVVAWADGVGRQWAFSLSNACARYTQFRTGLANLAEVNWASVAATDFRVAEVKESKQAEFLMHDSFPWGLVSRVGVLSQAVGQRVVQAMAGAAHRPTVQILPHWYY